MDNTFEFSCDNWLLYFRSLFVARVAYLLSSSTTCLCPLNCTFAQVIVHG